MIKEAIKVEELTYNYGDLLAVDHISFQVKKGEILGFLGPNGAGKTTTVKMLTGQLKPKAGNAEVLGFSVGKNVREVQSRIGICFEDTNLYEGMTARENLRLFARLFSVDGFDPDGLLERVGLKGRGREKVQAYSKGMKQRLMVARAILHRPEILFLDEPTDGLDPTSAESIRGVILEERGRGATVFLTTHNMAEADKLSDRVAFLDQGRIVVLDTPYKLKQEYGSRTLKAEVYTDDGQLEHREITLDTPDTPEHVRQLFADYRVATVHSEEATLEDIFIKITGRGLSR
ncbi:MAG: ABC transporter ATP-binding protein [Candidatus Bipolaricaulota bacterium]|nr:ABC transporter ATP-binding protein [Candidatus Bipolaricaulota bacterium]